ncbi:cation:proton antiporter [Chenggangzhangella methanolivorans]|uniref:Cation:proton antiporter n=1 Tax=Chenggangzhangella methanolivorans TaxID=1437009 RepID=A0A9E6UIQ4_9HYPH|nr:cation:proton antiporter [Chenggangzhangella methanolivorans]QZO01128.1 cation:proton antiporter [Chenggangzhangella methanolivorans]
MNLPQDWLPDAYILGLTGAGLLIALVVWLPLALRRLPLSLPIVCIAIGAAFFALPQVTFKPLPLRYPELTERLAEFVVIIALMGAGLRIDRVFGIRRWSVALRLIVIAMPLSIAAITAIGGWLLGLSWTVALLLGSVLAPTDPVLASDVQVGPPRTEDEDEVRFGLTAEAGLNDGFAFPFVHLAIALAASAATGKAWLAEWIAINVVWEIVVGIAAGYLIGRAFGWLTFHVPAKTKLAKTGDGLIALSATFVSYGLTEIIHCYGFLAVFVTALTFRHAHRDHEFQVGMHELAEQIERITMMALLLLFGGALVSGLLAPLQWVDVVAAFAVLLIVRPIAGLVGLIGHEANWKERLTLAFFGIRGVGSIYYLAFGLNHMTVEGAERLWAIVGLVILVSILMHGLTVTPIMRQLDRSQGRDPDFV